MNRWSRLLYCGSTAKVDLVRVVALGFVIGPYDKCWAVQSVDKTVAVPAVIVIEVVESGFEPTAFEITEFGSLATGSSVSQIDFAD